MDYFSINLSKCRLFDDGQGYPCFYMPKHPLARLNGTVALQRHILSVHLGRWLTDGEMVWFINKDRHDVRVENLQLVTQQEFLERLTTEAVPVELICNICGTPFTVGKKKTWNGRISRATHLQSGDRFSHAPQYIIERSQAIAQRRMIATW